MAKKQPGFKDLPVPEKNDLRPSGANSGCQFGEGRDVLKYAQGGRQVYDLGSPRPMWPWGVSTAPARADYTLGLRTSNVEAPVDPQPATVQPGAKRQ